MTGPSEKLWLIFTSDYGFALFTLANTVQVAPCRTLVPFVGQFLVAHTDRRRSCERDGQNFNPYACVHVLYPTPTVNRWRIISRNAVNWNDDLSICQFKYLWDGLYLLICLSRLLVHSMPGWLSWLPVIS